MNTSKVKFALFILFVIGIFAPYYFLVSHIATDGLNPARIYQEIVASKLASFGWMDVIVSAVVLLLAVFSVKGVSGRQAVLIVMATVCVGVSAGLPLFLYFLVDSGGIKLRK